MTADLAVTPLSPAAVATAEFIAFYLPMHTATRLAIPVIDRVKRLNPGARLAAFGLYAPLNAEYLGGLGIETVVGGEFEPSLVSAAESSSVRNGLISLDRLTFLTPDRTTLPPLAGYAQVHHAGQRKVTGYTEASRGCKHLCRHCPVVPVYEGTFRVVGLDVVLEDVRQQVAAGAAHITFGDPDFFNGPAHATRLVEALHSEWPDLTYDVTIKIEHLLQQRRLLPALQRTGCLWITSAAESTEDAVLEKLQKGHTRADFLEALRLTREAGLHLSPTFVPFTPWTTLQGYRDLLRTIAENDLVDIVAPIQLALRLLIPAGSRILELEDVFQGIGPFDPSALSYPWRHPDARVDALARGAFRLAADGQKLRLERRKIFRRLWALAHDGMPLENFDLMPRATIPYLNEPWYC
jgi:radical SAM superfamily enzyme YgiQ (UPF0313 family)